ncbi:MAG TPA: hypothetical protein VFF37_16305 [Streptomyces sp.]|nr:hypothetical protein [Streptomyces sp.]
MKKRRKSLTAACVMAAFVMIGGGAARAQELYDPPIWGDDLEPGERLWWRRAKHSAAGHPQEWGYDLLGVRHLSGRDWRRRLEGKSGNANDAFVIQGKRVHAMVAGTVIACWRNAPENAQAGEKHAQIANRRISINGNFLWIEEDDGERVLYAHAIPGSIPQRLCPHNGTLFAAPYAENDNQMPAESHVAAGSRARVAAGEFLMLVGNSGNSSQPHLHIHKIDASGAAARLNFRRGLSSPWVNDGADLDTWQSYAGSPIPQGSVLVWPPSRLGPEYARHKLDAGSFQRLLLHLSDSGYQPYFFDTYSVGGKSFINFVWRPSTARWSALCLRPESEYEAAVSAAENGESDPVLIESSLDGGGRIRYSAIFVKNKPGTWAARHQLTEEQHQNQLEQARRDKLSPASISVVSLVGIRFYTVLYNQDDIGGWNIKSKIPEGEFQSVFDEQKRAGRHPIYVNSYMHNGRPFISAIFAEKGGTASVGFGMSAKDFQDAYNRNVGGGLLTRSVTSFDGARREHRWAGVWVSQ